MVEKEMVQAETPGGSGETKAARGPDGRRQRDEDPRAPMALVVAFVGAVLVFVIVVALEAFFYKSEETERASKLASPPEELARLRAAQQAQLGSYGWVDQSKGIAAVPIDRAMELVVRDQGRNPQPAANKVKVPSAGPQTPGAGGPEAKAP
jgi:hypothetical protein